MQTDPFYIALWIGALVCASDATYDPFPVQLDELAAEYFSVFRPRAKA